MAKQVLLLLSLCGYPAYKVLWRGKRKACWLALRAKDVPTFRSWGTRPVMTAVEMKYQNAKHSLFHLAGKPIRRVNEGRALAFWFVLGNAKMNVLNSESRVKFT